MATFYVPAVCIIRRYYNALASKSAALFCCWTCSDGRSNRNDADPIWLLIPTSFTKSLLCRGFLYLCEGLFEMYYLIWLRIVFFVRFNAIFWIQSGIPISSSIFIFTAQLFLISEKLAFYYYAYY
jgi:hypothetical protein